MNSKKRILVAPLHWGLGHATRCIPIINALIEHGFEPIIASDGVALDLLKKEFPKLICLELPSYNIEYSKKGQSLKLKLFKNIPKILKAIKAEKRVTQTIIKKYKIDGIISDNRFGVYNSKVPSVYITHQLNVLSGNTTWISTKLHQHIIKKYDECWIPDVEGEFNLSGRLGHLKHAPFPLKYLGAISRFEKSKLPVIYDLLVLLSGPEPQRTIIEELLFKQLKTYKGKVLFIKGKVETKQTISNNGNFTIYNFMQTQELQKALNESKLIIARSGYTTVLDLTKLEKKAFFIPTPGQFEQEYIANRFDKKGIVASCKQKDFKIEMLDIVNNYKGLKSDKFTVNYKGLFSLFEGERKLTSNA